MVLTLQCFFFLPIVIFVCCSFGDFSLVLLQILMVSLYRPSFFNYQIQSYIKVIILLSAKSVICFLINQNTYSSLKLACLSSIIFVPIMKLVENTRECVVAPSDPIKVGSISLNGRLI